jgi:hypothetical protein
MVTLASLWLAILLSAVAIWITSAIVWMAMPHHRGDYKQLPSEAAVRSALAQPAVVPGGYVIPWMDPKEAQSEEGQKKYADGPIAFVTVVPSSFPVMGPKLILSFVFYLVVAGMVAYVTGRTVGAGAEYLEAFRIAGTTAFACYGFAVVQESIWFGRPWSTTFKTFFDALLYALITGGIFGWLWP